MMQSSSDSRNRMIYEDIRRTAFLFEGKDTNAIVPSGKMRMPAASAKPVQYSYDAANGRTTRAHAEVRFHPNAKTPSGTGAVDVASDPLQELDIGASVEFRSQSASKRVMRLNSISGQRGVYFFHDQKTNGAPLCLTAVRLSECLRERSARILTG